MMLFRTSILSGCIRLLPFKQCRITRRAHGLSFDNILHAGVAGSTNHVPGFCVGSVYTRSDVQLSLRMTHFGHFGLQYLLDRSIGRITLY